MQIILYSVSALGIVERIIYVRYYYHYYYTTKAHRANERKDISNSKIGPRNLVLKILALSARIKGKTFDPVNPAPHRFILAINDILLG